MSETDNHDWKPTPEQLAAFGDGELTGPDYDRVAAYLAGHPEAQTELADWRRLEQLLRATVPADPTEAAWRRVLDAVGSEPRSRPARRSPTARAVVAVAVAACLALTILLFRGRTPSAKDSKLPVDVEVLEVATADEIQILHVEGRDTATIVVGEMPLTGELTLADAGEIEVTSVQPAIRDRMMPVVHVEGRRPMIWARMDMDE